MIKYAQDWLSWYHIIRYMPILQLISNQMLNAVCITRHRNGENNILSAAQIGRLTGKATDSPLFRTMLTKLYCQHCLQASHFWWMTCQMMKVNRNAVEWCHRISGGN
jgi:hypothetical protein